MSTRKDKTGKRYGNLLVIKEIQRTAKDNHGGLWLLKCDCGTEFERNGYYINKRHRSCGCLLKGRPIESFEKLMKYENSTINFCYSHHRTNGRRKNGFLSKEEWSKIVFLPCYYCGGIDNKNIKKMKGYPNKIHLTEEVLKRYSVAINGVDRLDSSIGYVEGNCLPCCGMCNIMKSDHSKEVFLDKVKQIYEKQRLDNISNH
jgi:hypothetical protein